jgi:hypothetical protein
MFPGWAIFECGGGRRIVLVRLGQLMRRPLGAHDGLFTIASLVDGHTVFSASELAWVSTSSWPNIVQIRRPSRRARRERHLGTQTESLSGDLRIGDGSGLLLCACRSPESRRYGRA